MSDTRHFTSARFWLTALLLHVGAAPVLAAQLPGIGFGASVGANLPEGRFASGAKTGLVATGLVEVRAAVLGVRGELLWSRSDLDSPLIRRVGNAVLPSDGLGEVSGDVDLIGGLANVVLSLPGPVVQPYVIGGIGVYRRRVSQDVAGAAAEFRRLRDSDSSVGYNAGAGVRVALLGLTAFLEARYHRVDTSPERSTFVPITLGLIF